MNEQIYKLTDKGLNRFETKLFHRSEDVCGQNMIEISEAYETLFEVIEWDSGNARVIELEKEMEKVD